MENRNFDLESAVSDVKARFISANPNSQARFEAARSHMPGGNTRSNLHYDPFPVAITRGEGARIVDLDGHEYVDLLGEYTAGLYGHSERAIIDALKDVLDDGLVLGGPNRYEARLAELMCERFPALDLVRFCNSGTEANLMNLGLARVVTGRQQILAFAGAYHGGVLSFAGGASPLNAPFEFLLGQFNDVAGTRELIASNAEQIAAVIVEPVMGSGGCIPASRDFLEMLRDETRRAGIVLVFDEVMTSRLARGGMHSHLGITPDLVSFGKYLGGGVSFGAFGGRADIMARLDPTSPGALAHAGTYNNNVLSMAAGLTGLEKVFTPTAVERLNERGDRLRDRLNRIAEKQGAAVIVTGVGSMLCIHFMHGPIRNPADAAAAPVAARTLFHLEMKLRGYYLAPRGFMALSLPLTDEDCDGFAEAFGDFLAVYGPVLSAGETVSPASAG